MKKIGIFYLLIALLMVACGPNFETMQSGYQFRAVESNGGEPAGDGDALKVHMTIALGDSLVTDTRDFAPIGRRLAVNSMRPEFKEVVKRMGIGDSVQVKMNLYAYSRLEGQRGFPEDSAKMITMSIRVLDIKNEASMIESMVNDQLTYEKEQIEKYLVNNNLEAESTDEGIYYIISREGEGRDVEINDVVISNFTLKLMDGQVLTTTEEDVAKEGNIYREGTKYEPYQFSLQKDRLLEGWLIGVPLLKEGGKGTFFIPSRYAFGSNSAAGVIPPNATLIFDVELMDVK